MTNRTELNFTFISHLSNSTLKGPLLMLAAALVFAILDGLLKVMGPAYRVWDLAFLRWGGSLALLIIIFGRQGQLFKTDNLKLMIIRSITGCITFLLLIAAIRSIPLSTAMVLFFTFLAFLDRRDFDTAQCHITTTDYRKANVRRIVVLFGHFVSFQLVRVSSRKHEILKTRNFSCLFCFVFSSFRAFVINFNILGFRLWRIRFKELK